MDKKEQAKVERQEASQEAEEQFQERYEAQAYEAHYDRVHGWD